MKAFEGKFRNKELIMGLLAIIIPTIVMIGIHLKEKRITDLKIYFSSTNVLSFMSFHFDKIIMNEKINYKN